MSAAASIWNFSAAGRGAEGAVELLAQKQRVLMLLEEYHPALHAGVPEASFTPEEAERFLKLLAKGATRHSTGGG